MGIGIQFNVILILKYKLPHEGYIILSLYQDMIHNNELFSHDIIINQYQ